MEKGKRSKYGFLLTLISGYLIIGGGFLLLGQVLIHAPGMARECLLYLFATIIDGAGIIVGGALGYFFRRPRMGGVISTLWAIPTIFTGFGFIKTVNTVGAVLGILGGVLTFLCK